MSAIDRLTVTVWLVVFIWALGDIASAIRESAPPAPVPCAAPSRGPVGVLPEGS